MGRSGKCFTLDLQMSDNMFAVDDIFSYGLKSMVSYSSGQYGTEYAVLAFFPCKCCEKISVVFPLSSTSL